jgi:hypothetical protein
MGRQNQHDMAYARLVTAPARRFGFIIRDGYVNVYREYLTASGRPDRRCKPASVMFPIPLADVRDVGRRLSLSGALVLAGWRDEDVLAIQDVLAVAADAAEGL